MSAPTVVDIATLARLGTFEDAEASARHVNRIARRMQHAEDARLTAQREAAERSLDHAIALAGAAGEQRGFVRGTHWGMLVGFVAGVVVAGIAIGAWSQLGPRVLRHMPLQMLAPATGLTV